MIILRKLIFIFIPVLLCFSLFVCSCFFSNLPYIYTDTGVKADLPVIIIDAGHGGIDGGATTDDGTPEKDINLSISLYLDEYLKLMGFKTILTRTKDISLGESESTIRKQKTADIMNRFYIMENTDNALFISIHQNHFSQKQYSGLQVFYSEAYYDESSSLAQCIQDSAVNQLQKDNKRLIKECPSSVYLIHNAVKPSVLVECGFLSNEDEANKLKTDEYRKQISFCIAMGIQDYISTRIEK